MLGVHKYRDKSFWENYVSLVKDNTELRSMTERTRAKRLRSFASKENFKIVPVIVDQISFPPQSVKLMVPFRMLASQFTDVIRAKMQLPSYQSFNLLLNGRRVPSTMNMGEIHSRYKNERNLLCATIVPENTFGCPRPPMQNVTPEFDSLEGLPGDEMFENFQPNPQVIHLTAIVSNPDIPPPTPGQNSPVTPLGEGLGLIPQSHLQGIVNSIADAIVQAVSSPSVQTAILQSFPDSEITLSPQLVKDALLSYMHTHSITPPFNMDNFQTTIKITHEE